MDATRGVDVQSESEECKTSGARQAKRELEKGVTRRTGRASKLGDETGLYDNMTVTPTWAEAFPVARHHRQS